jgi:hypothetical protein
LLNGERPNLGGDGFKKLFFARMRAQCIKVFLDLIQLDPFVKIRLLPVTEMSICLMPFLPSCAKFFPVALSGEFETDKQCAFESCVIRLFISREFVIDIVCLATE